MPQQKGEMEAGSFVSWVARSLEEFCLWLLFLYKLEGNTMCGKGRRATLLYKRKYIYKIGTVTKERRAN